MNINSKMSFLLNFILLGIVLFYIFYDKKETSNNNVGLYDEKIDSLNNVIILNNKKIDSLFILETQQIENVLILKNKLSNVSNKYKELKKKYEKESARYDNMSNNDITDLFSKSFE